MKVAQENDLVLLISRDGKRYLLRLRAGQCFHTHRGMVAHDDLIGKPLGREVMSHLNQSFLVLQPSLYDLLMNLQRASQIVYPKDIGQILLRLDLGRGKCVVEAGTGSGILTIALAHAVQPDGIVYSHEMREDMLAIARRNLEVAGLLDRVRLIQRDIAEGFAVKDADSLFLDVREPWVYLPQACAALRDGGFFGAIVPTTNQVSWLLAEMEHHPFMSVEVMEVLMREYKPVPARLRPQDRMVAHTGFLIFARKVALRVTNYAASPREEDHHADRDMPLSADSSDSKHDTGG